MSAWAITALLLPLAAWAYNKAIAPVNNWAATIRPMWLRELVFCRPVSAFRCLREYRNSGDHSQSRRLLQRKE